MNLILVIVLPLGFILFALIVFFARKTCNENKGFGKK